jgi:hypothetical protein
MSDNTGAATVLVDLGVAPRDLERGQLYIEQIRNGITGSLQGLSRAQWTYKPVAEQWSIGEIVEHVVFVLERVSGPLLQALATAPPPAADRDFGLVDAIIINQFPNRLTKFPAPEAGLPHGRFESPSQGLPCLLETFAGLSERLQSTPGLREHALEAAPLKAATNGAHDSMDGYQWILAATAHAERHTKQILEVRAQGKFPAN